MSMQDKISSCRQIMSEVQSNKAKASHVSEQVKINNSFFDAYHNFLLPSLQVYITIKENTTFVFSSDMITKMTECLNIVSDALNKKCVLCNPVSFRANTVILRDGLSEEWKNHCIEMSTNILDNLGVLRLVYQDKLQVAKLIANIRGISIWPVSTEQITDYHKAIETANTILETVKFDPFVDTFLRKVRDKQATFADLTDPIIKWIRDNHFENSIQLFIQ